MARSIQTIFDEQKNEGIRQATAAGNDEMLGMFNNTSKVAVWRILFFSVAYCIWSFENVLDSFKALITAIIDALTPHNLRWYRTTALKFQYGFDLLPESFKFDNTGATAQQIEDSMLVKYVAVNEATVDGVRVLLMKIAGVDGDGKLTQVPELVELAFTAYVERFKDAGNVVLIYNRAADTVKGLVDVYYNPLLLDAAGNRLDGIGGKPLELAADAYLLQLDFNGEFSNAAFVDVLQSAYGVSSRGVFIHNLQKKTGAGAYTNINNSFIPEPGYIKYETLGLIFNYIRHV